MFAITKPL